MLDGVMIVRQSSIKYPPLLFCKTSAFRYTDADTSSPYSSFSVHIPSYYDGLLYPLTRENLLARKIWYDRISLRGESHGY